MTRTDTPRKTSSISCGARILRWLTDYAEDLLIVAGLGAIVAASFLIGVIPGLYTLGVVLVVVGALIARGVVGGR